jgi:hypothetical protein
MRVRGKYGVYDCEDDKFADGGGANLYKVKGSPFVFKKYHKPVGDAAAASKISSLVPLGRSTFVSGHDAPGSTPQASVCWPIDEIRVSTRTEGVIMPLIPGEFFRAGSKKPQTLAFLIRGRADPPRAWVRVSVLIRIAEVFSWLGASYLAHGDFSDANIVWRESPTPGAFLIDADGLQPADAVSPVGGMTTPGWIDPRVTTGLQPAHDQFSDWYGLALAMYRGLLLTPGNLDQRPDGTWPEPSNIPSTFPAPLRHLLTQTLSNPLNEKARTSPGQWEAVLRAEYLLSPQQFNSVALRKLDYEADKNRPARVTPGPIGRTAVLPTHIGQPQFNPLPQPPRQQRFAQQRTVQHIAATAPAKGRAFAKALGGVAAVVAVIMLISSLANASPSANDGSASNPPSTRTTSGPATTSSSPSAATLLAERAVADWPVAEDLVGTWVPQLSSKQEGTVDDNIVYDDPAILAHFNRLSQRFSDLLLVSSSDYPSFTKGGYWVVLVNRPFDTATAANSWCDSQGLDANDCFAKRLSYSGTPRDNTVNRGNG